MEPPFKIFNLVTKQTSKQSYQTYKGALKGVGENEIISTQDGIDWITRHPEWCEERILLASKKTS